MFRFNLIEKIGIKFNLGKRREMSNGVGGDAGEIFLAVGKIQGDGKITADGGDGVIGGKGGKITILSDDDQFSGEISAKGGRSMK